MTKLILAGACAGRFGTRWSVNLRGMSIATVIVVENIQVHRLVYWYVVCPTSFAGHLARDQSMNPPQVDSERFARIVVLR
jgi:hypothetical protein